MITDAELSDRDSCQTAITKRSNVLRSIASKMTQDRIGRDSYFESVNKMTDINNEILTIQKKLITLI